MTTTHTNTFSAAHSQQLATPTLSPVSTLTQVAGTLGGILLLILCLAWLLKRLGFISQHKSRERLKITASCQVGSRERVVVVEVEGTWLVLGVTAQQITPLHSLPAPTLESRTDFRQQLNARTPTSEELT